jgi:uncharacterized protein (TIGR02391 family)
MARRTMHTNGELLMIDNIQLLKAIDERQLQMEGRPVHVNASQLLNELSGTFAADPKLMPGFLQELFMAQAAGYLTWRIYGLEPNRNNPNYYLQQIQELALTVAGQDRARGRVVVAPLPDPDEDDGHDLSDLVVQQVAEIITGEYAPDQRVRFLAEEGIPPAWLQMPDGAALDDVHAVLAATWRGGSLGRQLVRRFLGRWLDERLLTGPDQEQRASLIGQLMRQGWQIRESDSVLEAAEPIRGIPVAAPPMHTWRPHTFVEAEARPQFLIRNPGQAVFTSMRAVEIRIREMAGLGDDLYGVDLVNKAFGSGGSLAEPPPPGGKHNDGPRSLFAGAMAMYRNPAGHTMVTYDGEAEAVEAVALASLLMRHLDRVEARLVEAGRTAQPGGAASRT